ncbi:hypothetical protein ACQP2X_48950 [Actinoplanes sp. CA-131856]
MRKATPRKARAPRPQPAPTATPPTGDTPEASAVPAAAQAPEPKATTDQAPAEESRAPEPTTTEKPAAVEATAPDKPAAAEATAPDKPAAAEATTTEKPAGGEVTAEKAATPRARRPRAAKTAAASGGGTGTRSKAAPREHVQEELIPQGTVEHAEVRSEPAATVWKEPASPAPDETAAVVVVRPAVEKAERTDPWAALIADPARAPELLAIAAVQTLGPRAQEWATRTREAYPTAGTDALVRLATRQFTRFGSLTGLVGAVAGAYAPVALLGAAAFTDAELSLHIAAAYGLDPTDEERAADLLVIGRVHATKGDAIDALAEARRPAYDSKEPLWRLAGLVAAQSAAWVAVKVVNRRFPGTSLLAALLSTTASAQATAARAAKYYKSARSS